MVEADFQRFYRLDLRDEIETAGPRRLWALVRNLPPESATHRAESLPPVEELLATLVERMDAWNEPQLMLALGQKRVIVPSRMRIRRPSDPPPQERKIESDPRAIAAWFAKHVGGR